MASDVADIDALKHDMIHLLLKHPQGIESGDFSGAFYKFHGHHPQLALHGYGSLKCLLNDMKNMVVLEKNPQATVIKLANEVPLNPLLDEGEGWDSFEEKTQNLRNEEAEGEADPCGPAASLDADFSTHSSIPQKMNGKESVLAAALVPILSILQGYPKGLKLQTLMENLKKRGFDLERFSHDMGYSDTIHCLLDMPGLHLIFFNDMVPQNCVVQLLSSSSGFPPLPLSAGCSLHKPLSSSAAGTCPQSLMETKPASHSSMTSQASASLSCDLDHSTSNSKTPNENMLGKKPAPAAILALLSNLLNNYLEGLRVKKLQEILLTMNGFDLEKFSIAQGYKDTLEFLEHQMPELEITYREQRCNCVVKQASHSSTTSQASASLSSDLDCSASKPKTLKENGLGKKPAPAKVLALLANLINIYPVGLRVKKLQELLLATKGFDLEKFSIAQGYKDALEFLEHQMPELKMKYHGDSRQNCVVKQGKKKKQKKSQDSQEKVAKPPAEVLASLTNLLSNYTLGLKVKKLQEILLTMEGFDLEKFSVARGYKDTLEFLEDKMPELTIKYNESRQNCVVKQDSGVISKPSFREVTKAGPGGSALLQNGLHSSIPVPFAVIPSHPAPSAMAKSSLQPHSDIPAQQPSVCQSGGRSAAGELPHLTYAQVLSKSSPTKPSHSELPDNLRQQVAHILARHPEGMSLFQFRAAYSSLCQHHLPLGNASSAKQRLLEMSDIVCMKGYGVQTVLLPVSPEKPPTKPGLPVFSRVENAATVLADPLPRAAVRSEPALVSKPSFLKTPMELQPHAARPSASDHLRAPDIKENHVLPNGQCPTTLEAVAPLQEPVRPKAIFGGYLDSFKAEEASIKENCVLFKRQCPTTPQMVAPLQRSPKITFGAPPDLSKAEEAAKNLGHSSTKAAVKIEPVVVSESRAEPSLSETAAVPVPQLHPFVPQISTGLRAPGNKESSVLPESLPLGPPKPAVPVRENVRARPMPAENLFIPHSPVVFPVEPHVSRLNGVWTSDSLASPPMYLANPSFSVNIPVPSLFQPVLTHFVATSQPVVYPPLPYLPDTPAHPSLVSPSYRSVSGTLPRTQLQKTESASFPLAQPAPQNRPAKPTSPIRHTEQSGCPHTPDRPDALWSASRTPGQSHSQAPGFTADGDPVSSPSVKPPSLQPLKSPPAQQPENVQHTWLSSMPCSPVPPADDSVVASPSARARSQPVVPAFQKQHDAVMAPLASPRTPSPTASHQPASSPFGSRTESDTIPSKPPVSMPLLQHVPVSSAVTTSNTQPPALLQSSPGSPVGTASQPSYVSFRPNTGYDTSRQNKPLPGISREASGQDNHNLAFPDDQRYHLKEESMPPPAPQNSRPRQSSDNCVIL